MWGAVLGAAHRHGAEIRAAGCAARAVRRRIGNSRPSSSACCWCCCCRSRRRACGRGWRRCCRSRPRSSRDCAAAPTLPQRDKRGDARTLLAVRKRDASGSADWSRSTMSASTSQAGEILALIGPNGAGKSTTFNMVTGVLQPTRRHDHVPTASGSTSCTPQAIARLGVARTFQHVKLVPDMSVIENVALGAHLRGHASALASMLRLDRAEEAALLRRGAQQLARVGLGRCRALPAASLPLGQQRLVEIARALCHDPIAAAARRAGRRPAPSREGRSSPSCCASCATRASPSCWSSTTWSFVMDIADRIVVLDFGTKIAEGSAAEVRRQSRRDRSLSRGRRMSVRLLDVASLRDLLRQGRGGALGVAACRTQGEIVTVIGANGAGKTTLLNAMMGAAAGRAAALRSRARTSRALDDRGPRRARAVAWCRSGASCSAPCRSRTICCSARFGWAKGRDATASAAVYALFPRLRSGGSSSPARSRAASSRCWRSAAR